MLADMANAPTTDGLRLVYHRPALVLAEVVWRWTFAASLWLLLAFLFMEYLGSLAVSRGDLTLLRSGIPWLVVATLRHILLQGIDRFTQALVVLASSGTALWMLAASLGRAAIVKVLLKDLCPDFRAGRIGKSEAGSLLGLHFLRAGLLLACSVGSIGAAIFASFASSARSPRPGLVFFLFFGLTLIIAIVWRKLDWLLSLAPVFVLRDGEDTFGSISATIQFVRENYGPVVKTSALFAIIHLAAFFAASSIASVPFTFIALLPGWLLFGVLFVLTLTYFVVADYLYVARLAAYIMIMETGPQVPAPAPLMPPPPVHQRLAPLDDDDISSDIPGLVPPPEPA